MGGEGMVCFWFWLFFSLLMFSSIDVTVSNKVQKNSVLLLTAFYYYNYYN